MDPRKYYRFKRENEKAERKRNRWLDYCNENPRSKFRASISSSYTTPPPIELDDADDTPTLGTRMKRWGFSQTPKRKCTPIMAEDKLVEKYDNEAEPIPPPPPPNALIYSESTAEGGNGDVDVKKISKCSLGGCPDLTANTEKNLGGRKVYRCPGTEENGGCGFVEWCDNSSTTTAAKAQYSVSSAAQSPTPSSTFPDVPCPCGAGVCLVLKAKTEKNMGQQFYRCPASQERKCNFFKWCIERNSTIGQQSSTNLKTFSNTSSSINKSSSSGESPCSPSAGETVNEREPQFSFEL